MYLKRAHETILWWSYDRLRNWVRNDIIDYKDLHLISSFEFIILWILWWLVVSRAIKLVEWNCANKLPWLPNERMWFHCLIPTPLPRCNHRKPLVNYVKIAAFALSCRLLASLFILWFTDNFRSVTVRIGQVVPVTNDYPQLATLSIALRNCDLATCLLWAGRINFMLGGRAASF